MTGESVSQADAKQIESLMTAIGKVNENILASLNKSTQTELIMGRIEERLKHMVEWQEKTASQLSQLENAHGMLKMNVHTQPNPHTMRTELDAMKLADARRDGMMTIIQRLLWAGVVAVFGLTWMMFKLIGTYAIAKAITGGP